MPKKLKAPKDLKQLFVPVLVILVIGLAFFSGTLWQKVQNLEKGTTTTAQTSTTQTPPPAADLKTIKGLFSKNILKFGDANSKILFVEVSDPSCPYCHIAGGQDPELASAVGARFTYQSDGGTYIPPFSEMEKLVKSGQASLAYIYFPGHGNGEMAMKALYCATEQGKFWEVHDLLMSDAGYGIQNGTTSTGATVANSVGNDKTKSGELATFLKSAIDPSFMKSCLDSGKYDAQLQSDQELAASLGTQGTPNFYVNDKNFPGAYSYSDMQSTVDSFLK